MSDYRTTLLLLSQNLKYQGYPQNQPNVDEAVHALFKQASIDYNSLSDKSNPQCDFTKVDSARILKDIGLYIHAYFVNKTPARPMNGQQYYLGDTKIQRTAGNSNWTMTVNSVDELDIIEFISHYDLPLDANVEIDSHSTIPFHQLLTDLCNNANQFIDRSIQPTVGFAVNTSTLTKALTYLEKINCHIDENLSFAVKRLMATLCKKGFDSQNNGYWDAKKIITLLRANVATGLNADGTFTPPLSVTEVAQLVQRFLLAPNGSDSVLNANPMTNSNSTNTPNNNNGLDTISARKLFQVHTAYLKSAYHLPASIVAEMNKVLPDIREEAKTQAASRLAPKVTTTNNSSPSKGSQNTSPTKSAPIKATFEETVRQHIVNPSDGLIETLKKQYPYLNISDKCFDFDNPITDFGLETDILYVHPESGIHVAIQVDGNLYHNAASVKDKQGLTNNKTLLRNFLFDQAGYQRIEVQDKTDVLIKDQLPRKFYEKAILPIHAFYQKMDYQSLLSKRLDLTVLMTDLQAQLKTKENQLADDFNYIPTQDQKSNLAAIKQELQALSDKILDLDALITAFHEEYLDLDVKLIQQKKDIDELSTQLADLRASLKDKNAEIEKLNEKIKAKEKKARTSPGKNKSPNKSSCEDNTENFAKMKDDAISQANALRPQINEITEKHTQLQEKHVKSLAYVKDKTPGRALINQFNALHEDLNQKLSNVQTRLDAIQVEEFSLLDNLMNFMSDDTTDNITDNTTNNIHEEIFTTTEPSLLIMSKEKNSTDCENQPEIAPVATLGFSFKNTIW